MRTLSGYLVMCSAVVVDGPGVVVVGVVVGVVVEDGSGSVV